MGEKQEQVIHAFRGSDNVFCNNYKTFNDYFGLEKQMKIYHILPPG